MRFKAFVKKYKNIANPIGDFARDVCADENFPNTNWYGEILEYLNLKGVCNGAIDAFNNAYSLFKMAEHCWTLYDENHIPLPTTYCQICKYYKTEKPFTEGTCSLHKRKIGYAFYYCEDGVPDVKHAMNFSEGDGNADSE